MSPPQIRYLEREGVRLAYQVVGNGTHDVVWTLELNEHIDLLWTDPYFDHLYERAMGYARAVLFQRRGFGLSDPVDYVPSLQQQAEDILAVMDAAGMACATLSAHLSTTPAAVLVAATQPARVKGLLLANPVVQGPSTTKPILGCTRSSLEEFATEYLTAMDRYGEGVLLGPWERTNDASFNRRLMATLERCSASRQAARAQIEWMFSVDVTDLLGSISCPVRVVYTTTGFYPAAVAQGVAGAVAHGSCGPLAAPAPGAPLGQGLIPWIDELQALATGSARPADADRKWGSILVTDLVGSTELLSRIGDIEYGQLRVEHEDEVRHLVELHGGVLANVSGDGTLSLFENPTAAVRCAIAVRSSSRVIGLRVRAGVHAGQINWTAADVSGLAVHVAARVSAAAGSDEILVSRAVRDLLSDSAWSFAVAGTHELKGVPGSWDLYQLGEAEAPASVPNPAPATTRGDRLALRLARDAPAVARLGIRMGNALQRRRSKQVLTEPLRRTEV